MKENRLINFENAVFIEIDTHREHENDVKTEKKVLVLPKNKKKINVKTNDK
jgi:hypothetical protein